MKIRLTLLASMCVLATGCSTMTTIDSTPAGAKVHMNGKYLGDTPLTTKVDDIWGKHSVYSFTATANGKTQRKDFKEWGWADPTTTIPGKIDFAF